MKRYGQLNLQGRTKIEVTIERLRQFEPPEGYIFANSYGKDSTLTDNLLLESGVKYHAEHYFTGLDAPELIQFGEQNFPDTEVLRPSKTFWQSFQNRGFPYRKSRWCCQELKEYGGSDRLVVTGVRWAESPKRKGRPMFQYFGKKKILNPIIDWTNNEVWEYIKVNHLSYCSLYDEGFKRLGCILCPMTNAKQVKREMARWPKIARAWEIAFEKFYEKNKGKESLSRWHSWRELWLWWLSRERPKNESQCVMFQ